MWGGIWRVGRGSFGLSALVCWSARRASTMGRERETKWQNRMQLQGPLWKERTWRGEWHFYLACSTQDVFVSRTMSQKERVFSDLKIKLWVQSNQGRVCGLTFFISECVWSMFVVGVAEAGLSMEGIWVSSPDSKKLSQWSRHLVVV